MRFAFYVSGKASRFLKLIEKKSPVLKDTIFVINDNAPHPQLHALLSEKKIRYKEISYKKLGLAKQEKNIYISELLLKMLKTYTIDYCFCFGSRVLTGAIVKEYKHRIINFHPSVLPLFPGEKSIDQALKAESFLMGNTAHFIDESVDNGPIIMQSIIHRKQYETYDTVLDLQIPMIEQIYYWLVDKRLTVDNNVVFVKNADYSSIVFYPAMEQIKK